MVGVKGLEPSTSRSQTARASQLRHTPIGGYLGDYTVSLRIFPVVNGLSGDAKTATIWITRYAKKYISKTYECLVTGRNRL
jgi:hypothetical protein